MAIRSTFSIPNTQIPTEGPVGVNIPLDFTSGNISSGDLALEMMAGSIGFVQSVWIDNSANTKQLTLTISGTQQAIVVKANSQGFYPVIAAVGRFSWSAVSTGAAVIVPVIFMNVDRQAAQWLTV